MGQSQGKELLPNRDNPFIILLTIISYYDGYNYYIDGIMPSVKLRLLVTDPKYWLQGDCCASCLL